MYTGYKSAYWLIVRACKWDLAGKKKKPRMGNFITVYLSNEQVLCTEKFDGQSNNLTKTQALNADHPAPKSSVS